MIRSDAEEASAAFNQLVTTTGDRSLFPRAHANTAFSAAAWRRILGLRLTLGGEQVIAVRTDQLASFCRDKATQRRLQQQLSDGKVLLRGHGGKSTRQPIKLKIGGEIQRPRFWLLNAKRLAVLASGKDG